MNPQCYTADDVGRSKVKSLAAGLRAINPLAQIEECDEWITPENAARIIAGREIVFDTVDFLDLSAIVALHDAARQARQQMISAVSAGYGAALLYFPPDCPISFREAFGCPRVGPVDKLSYVERFTVLLKQLRQVLSPVVVDPTDQALKIMQDGTPCPAPHLAVGAQCVASLAMTAAIRILAGQSVADAPHRHAGDSRFRDRTGWKGSAPDRLDPGGALAHRYFSHL